MTAVVESARPELVAVVGESHVVSEPTQCSPYAIDGRSPRYVVSPTSAEQVAAVLKWASDRGLGVIPCRSATKLTLGNPVVRYDVALALNGLNNIWHYEPADLTVSAEPGLKFSDFQSFVSRHHLWLPLDPPAARRASLGGILATNSAGPLRLRYGAPRDMVLGMKIATTEGRLIKTGGRVVKNVAGYDLAKLLVGSYGTLGVIVEASLKLYPEPAERATFVLRSRSLEMARSLRQKILASSLQPLRLVVLNGVASSFVQNEVGSAAAEVTEMWVEVGGSTKVTERYTKEFHSLGKGAGVPVERWPSPNAEALWTRISDFPLLIGELHPGAVIVKGALPPSASEAFLERAQEEARSAGVRLASVGQTGVGIAHLACLDEMPSSAMVPLIQRLRKTAEEYQGALIVERCAPDIKGAVDVWGIHGDDLEIMGKLKRAWDPQGILSPGRLLNSG